VVGVVTDVRSTAPIRPDELDVPPPGAEPGQRRRSQPWVYLALALGLVVVAGPFVWMLLGSVKPEAELRRSPPTWLPEEVTLENYRQLFSRLDFPQYFINSTLVATAVTIGNLVICSMLGYALAKMDFPGKRVLFLLVLGVLMVPSIALLVPQFVLVSNMRLVNTYLGLILPSLALVLPFGVFLMRQYISGLPDELIDAARVDGAGEFRIFAQVIAPLTTPALATLGILTFLGSWNSFLWPLVVAQTEDKYTLPVALALYSVGQNRTQYGLLMAGAVVVVVPVLLVFIALQRYFVQGIAMTGIK
jgi:multiple sugar transport system permease protein